MKKVLAVVVAVLATVSTPISSASASASSVAVTPRIEFPDAVLPPGVQLPFADAPAGFVLGSRVVAVDVAEMKRAITAATAAGTDLEVELMPGTTLSVRPGPMIPLGLDESYRPAIVYGSWSWSGSVRDASGDEASWVSLAVTEANTTNRPYAGVAGTFVSGDRKFELAPVGAGVHAIVEVDPAMGGDIVEEPHVDDSEGDEAEVYSSESTGDIGDGLVDPGPMPGPTPMHHGNVVIDVLVVFSTAAKTDAGVGDVAATIDADIGRANDANHFSGAQQVRFRIVGTREVTHTAGAMGEDLDRLRGTTDGTLDFVHSWRDQTGADLVVLFGAGYAAGTACGIANRVTNGNFGPRFAPLAFAVVDIDRTRCDRFTAAHEIGHLLAMRHDWDEPVSGNGENSPYTFNHGHASRAGGFRTIMAYASVHCSNAECPRIPNWSNPNVRVNGQPTGVPEGQPRAADNARALLNTAPHAVNWRTGPSGPFVGAPYWVSWDILEDVHYRNDGLGGAHVLEGLGGIHQTGGAPPPMCCHPYWPNDDKARGIDLVPSTTSGVTLDGYGGIHAWGDVDLDRTDQPWRPGWDIFRGVKLVRVEDPLLGTPVHLGDYHYGGVTVDGFGGLHAWGGASIDKTGAPWWGNTAHDIARGVALRGDGGGYTLDGWGGIHRWGGAPPIGGPPYYPGIDWYRGMSLGGSSGYAGYAIDGYGGIYPFT